jgi:hypothetical protein
MTWFAAKNQLERTLNEESHFGLLSQSEFAFVSEYPAKMNLRPSLHHLVLNWTKRVFNQNVF